MTFRTVDELKPALVKAHREQDWELAKELSQIRERLKKKRHCLTCGVRVQGASVYCRMHANISRYYLKSITQ